jgi:hypothetical protein
MGRSTTGHFQPQACLQQAFCTCATLLQQTITSFSNSFGLFWYKMVSENQMHTASQCQHTVFLLSECHIFMEFGNVMPLMASKIQWAVALTSISTAITYQYINLCNVMTANDKPLLWSMQYFMWWHTISMTHSSQVKYKSLRLYSATCGMSALVWIINVLTVELLCNLCAGFFCNY